MGELVKTNKGKTNKLKDKYVSKLQDAYKRNEDYICKLVLVQNQKQLAGGVL